MGYGTDFTIQLGLYAVIVIGVVKATMDVSDVCDRHLFLVRFYSTPFGPYSSLSCTPESMFLLFVVIGVSQMMLGSSQTGSYIY